MTLSNWTDKNPQDPKHDSPKPASAADDTLSHESRSCRALLVADSCVNCRQLSYMLTSFFSDCGVLCSFDVFSNRKLLCKMINGCFYDIIFVPRDLLESDEFISAFPYHPQQCPIVLYVYVFSSLTYPQQTPHSPREALQYVCSSPLIADSFSLPFLPPKCPSTFVGPYPISAEVVFPFTILDVAYIILQHVFLPVFSQFDMDAVVLESKCFPFSLPLSL